MKKNKILIGTRASKLATIYANRAKNEIKKVFSGDVEVIKISTEGDKNCILIILHHLFLQMAFAQSKSKYLILESADSFSVAARFD